jgi:hypothetical protein
MDKAVGYLIKSLEITVKINARYEMLENYRNLAHANAILHNFNSADSLQNLFAETYSILYKSDSISHSRKHEIVNDEKIVTSTSSASDWLIAYSLMTIALVLSVIAYRGDKKRH